MPPFHCHPAVATCRTVNKETLAWLLVCVACRPGWVLLSAARHTGPCAAAHPCLARRSWLQTGDFATLARAFDSTIAVSGSISFHDTGIVKVPAGIFPRLEAVGENLMMTQNQGSGGVLGPMCRQTSVELRVTLGSGCVHRRPRLPPGCSWCSWCSWWGWEKGVGTVAEKGRLPTDTSSVDAVSRVVMRFALGCLLTPVRLGLCPVAPCRSCAALSAMTSTEGFASLHSVGGELRLASNTNLASATFAALHQVWHSGPVCLRTGGLLHHLGQGL